MRKLEQYRQLVSEIRTDYLNGSRELKWCEDCKEVNLWTYWQGRGHMDAQVMLVGQDWGCAWDESAAAVIENVRAMNDGKTVYYMAGNDNPTDKLLTVLFESIGFDISRDDPRLFFTNFVLGYRVKGTSGGFKKKWADANAKYFRRLVEIISPRILLCLGKDTTRSVLNCFGLPMPTGSFNKIIEDKSNPFCVRLSDGNPVYIFALAHCGVMGTLNRNRGSGKKLLPDLQIQDWSRIRPILWSSPELLHNYWVPTIKGLRSIIESDERVAWCRTYSVYAVREDIYGIERFFRKLLRETYQNGLVISDYRKIMDELGLEEEKIIRSESDWVEQLSVNGAAACLAYHFRRDHFCEGSLIQNGLANGCILRLMERLYSLLAVIS